MIRPRNLMIRASAGSGKTHRLTERFIALLEAGVEPERIVALTFTRKAAGEFFDAILKRLADAAEKRPQRYGPLLRRMIEAMPRLRLGTLDAFFAQIVRGFPFELGLTGDFELLQDHAAHLERRRVLRRMFARSQPALEAAQKEFVEAFKLATMGAEEKRLAARLDRYLDEHHQVFLSASAAGLWGNPERIWPDGPPWRNAPGEIAGALRALRGWAGSAPIGEKQRQRWLDFCAAAEEWVPGATPPRALVYGLERALESLEELRRGPLVLKFDRKEQPLTAEAAGAFADLALALVAAEFTRRIAMTQGIQKLLANYESFYHDAVRRGGRLTFADVQRLLEPVRLQARGESAPEEGRLAVDYRLDGLIDHWLLDEFQDTSFGQWTVLSNLIDEVISDASGTRTFFCVGDVKQAIYGWRDGDHRLFGEILAQYNASVPPAIEEEQLVQSWRSAPAVIELVNAVFGQAQAIGNLFAGPAADQWNAEWGDHVSAHPQWPGQSAVLVAADRAGRWQAALDILLEVDPSERGLTCAVLVQRNEAAAELAEYLRREGGLPAVAEADLHVCADNPVGAALLALVQVAEHPGDMFAWQHVRMSPPLAAWLDARGWQTAEALSTGLLGALQREGYAGTLAGILEGLEAHFAPDDRFNRTRARQFVAAAALFDESGGRSAAEFVEFMQRYTLREPESAAVIRVMTIHKSKGLGFDVVVVPDLQETTLFEAKRGLAVRRAPDRSVEWILDLPSKLFWENDPIVAAHVEAEQAAGCYENLAALYVALTRAKRGLYVVTQSVPETSTSKNYARLLAQTLGEEVRTVQVGGRALEGTWQAGDPQWFLKLAPEAPLPAALPLRAFPEWEPSAERRLARRPSAEGQGAFELAGIFSLKPAAAREFGRAVHALLAGIEWADAGQRARTAAAWRAAAAQHPAGAAEAAASCLVAADNVEVWERPDASAGVWRERAFELVADDNWISGQFDRVVVRRNAAGAPIAATIYDFKTLAPEAEPDAARHEGQLSWYRRAAARLTGLPESAVAARLVWVRG